MSDLGLTFPRITTLLLSLVLAACSGEDGVLTEHASSASASTTDTTSPGGDTTDTTGPGSDTTVTSGADTTTDAATTDDSETTTGEALCQCILDDPEGEWIDPSLPTCAASICPTVAATFEFECDIDCVGEVDEEALLCALTALRDRTPGLVGWSLDIPNGGIRDNGYIWIRGDGSAIWRKWEEMDLGFEASAAQIVALPSSDKYAQCLAESDPVVRFDCLRQSLSSPDNVVCDEGWQAEEV